MRSTSISNMNVATGEPLVNDAKREAAGRCLALLYSAAIAARALRKHALSPQPGLVTEDDLKGAQA